MSCKLNIVISAIIVAAGFAIAPLASRADDLPADAVYGDIQKTFGSVPTFIKQLPKAALEHAV